MGIQVNRIQVNADSVHFKDCVGAILVPEIVLTEPGYLKTMTVNTDAHSKHEFFAMAQMAYYQYQDEELSMVRVKGAICLQQGGRVEVIDSGMVICRDGAGELLVLLHDQVNAKKILEAANRYCTRWVRLDI